MKRLTAVVAIALLLPVCVVALGGALSGSPLAIVPSDEASRIYGGACNTVYENLNCNGSGKGCVKTDGEKVSTDTGSWQVETTTYCGVQECGSVVTTKKCDS